MKEKILLVFAGKKDIYKPMMPLPLLALVPYLKEAGFGVEILDTRVDSYEDIDLNDVLLVGFSTNTGAQIRFSLEVARHIKKKYPEIPLVWGGTHPSLLPEETLENDYVDIVVRGEGEETLPELAAALRDHSTLHAVKGIFFKEGGKTTSTESRGLMDLSRLKCPAYDLVDKDKYNTSFIHYFFSRGCPFRCRFCCESVWNQGKTYRTKDIDLIISDLEYIKKVFNPDLIKFSDDNVLVDKAKFEELCRRIITLKLNLNYVISGRIEHIARASPEFMTLLKESGCTILRLGGESGSQEVLDYVHKDIKLSEMVKAAEVTKRYGIVPQFSFMIGFPKETKEDIKKTLNLIDMLRGINPQTDVNGICVFTPYPGTELYGEGISLGFKPPQSFEEWCVHDFGKTIDMPWYSLSKGRYLLTIELVSRFPIFTEKAFRTHRKLPFFQELAYWFYFHSARFRWKHKWFSLGVEWWLFNRIRAGNIL